MVRVTNSCEFGSGTSATLVYLAFHFEWRGGLAAVSALVARRAVGCEEEPRQERGQSFDREQGRVYVSRLR